MNGKAVLQTIHNFHFSYMNHSRVCALMSRESLFWFHEERKNERKTPRENDVLNCVSSEAVLGPYIDKACKHGHNRVFKTPKMPL